MLCFLSTRQATAKSPSHKILVVSPGRGAAITIAYELPFSVLQADGFAWRFRLEGELNAEDLTGCTLLILYRCRQARTIAFLRLARKKGIPILYELDDDLLAPPPDESWGEPYRNDFRWQIIETLLTEADLIKAGSPELAKRLKKRGFRAIYRPYPVKLLDLPTKKREEAPVFRVGYFGTPHHRKDIEAIFPALLRIDELFRERVQFEFVGCYPEGWSILKRVVIHPCVHDYFGFLKRLAALNWTVGLAPLRPTPFNKAKSDSKFRDYTAAAITGIYADLPPYRHTVRPGINGWLAGNHPAEWVERISEALLDAKKDKKLAVAREQVRRNNSPETVAAAWRGLYEKLKSKVSTDDILSIR
ncbi:MAG: glycosyltransferase family 4 protein [Firmicutes bacterium]|nr:glycosyltransferase family 4 protein [Bacillota bacterium]